jgi:beta-galactosidase
MGKELDWFAMHPGQTGHWLGSAGVLGATEISLPTTLTVGKAKPAGSPRLFDVKLYFVEPAEMKSGRRVFDISLEGKTVLKGLDVANEAGGSHRPITREFRNVEISGPLDIRLSSTAGKTLLSAVEIIAK